MQNNKQSSFKSVKIFYSWQRYLVSLLLVAATQAHAGTQASELRDAQSCSRVFVGGEAEGLTKPIVKLQPGQLLTLSIKSKPIKVYYLGHETAQDGRSRFVFLDAVSANETIRVYEDQFSGSMIAKSAENWIPNSSEQSEQNCGAHAAAACLIAHSPALRNAAISASNGAIESRQALIGQATLQLYARDGEYFATKVQTFLKERGVESKTMILDSERNKQVLLDLLKEDHPVYMIYSGTNERYYQDSKVFDRGYLTENDSRHKYITNFKFSSDESTLGRHAIVLLKAIKVGNSFMVLALDSAVGELRLIWWNQILEASPREPNIIVVPGTSVEKTQSGVSHDTITELESSHREPLGKFLVEHSEQVEEVTGHPELVAKSTVGDWVLLRHKPGATKIYEPQVVTGRIAKVYTDDKGQKAVEIQTYEFGKLFTDRGDGKWTARSQWVWESQLRNMEQIHIIRNPKNEFSETLVKAQCGDTVKFGYSEFPFSDPLTITAVVMSKSSNTLNVFDLNSKKIIQLAEGDHLLKIKLAKTKNWNGAENLVRQAFASEAIRHYQSEGYAVREIDQFPIFEAKIAASKIVYPTQTDQKFDTALIPAGARVIIKLKPGYVLRKSGKYEYSVDYGKITSITSNSITFDLGWGQSLELVPEQVESIFLLER